MSETTNKYGQVVDEYGNVILLKDQLASIAVPMYIAAAKENFEVHSTETALMLTAMGLFGVGTNTYGTFQEQVEKEYQKKLGKYEFESRKEASESLKSVFRKQAEIDVKQKLIKERYENKENK